MIHLFLIPSQCLLLTEDLLTYRNQYRLLQSFPSESSAKLFLDSFVEQYKLPLNYSLTPPTTVSPSTDTTSSPSDTSSSFLAGVGQDLPEIVLQVPRIVRQRHIKRRPGHSAALKASGHKPPFSPPITPQRRARMTAGQCIVWATHKRFWITDGINSKQCVVPLEEADTWQPPEGWRRGRPKSYSYKVREWQDRWLVGLREWNANRKMKKGQ